MSYENVHTTFTFLFRLSLHSKDLTPTNKEEDIVYHITIS